MGWIREGLRVEKIGSGGRGWENVVMSDMDTQGSSGH